MRILLVSTVPPTRCGIATYAAQEAARLREEGHEVTIASLDGAGEAALKLDLKRAAEIGRLAALVPSYDRCILHYQHDFFFTGLDQRQLVIHNALLAGLFAHGVEVVAHEVIYDLLAGGAGRLVQHTERLKWRAAKRIVVHTLPEESRLRALVPGARIVRRDHDLYFRAFRDVDQATARRELDVPAAARVFLCIGFLQRHKGFDRAMAAFASNPASDARLYVVGSARVEHPEIRAHVEELRQLAARDPRVVFHERFPSDAEFDTWIAASDVVVLPYREIWSSSVAARARLLGRRVIATAVGGLADQLGSGDVVVQGDAELAAALRGVSPAPSKAARVRRTQLRLAVVPPWYGGARAGGGERVVRATAEHLRGAGVHVEVFTTRIADYFSDWSRNAQAAEETVSGVWVHRFPVEKRETTRFGAAAEKVRQGLALSADEEAAFFGEMIRCPGLPAALAHRRADFDLFLLPHYMFQTTLQAARVVGEQAVLLPFLHDEPYARLAPYAEMFGAARGSLFLSAPEAELARTLYGLAPARSAVVGTGVDFPKTASREAFSRRHGVGPYLVYVGRKESGKNFPELLAWFRAVRAQFPGLRLVTLGARAIAPEPGGGDGRTILDLGIVSDREKMETLAGALALVQPSTLESFSLAIMESWTVGRPVIVHAGCAVTAHHVAQAKGGFAVEDAAGFAAAVAALIADERLAGKLGRQGRAYVKREFAWPAVTARLLSALERFQSLPALGRSAA